MWSRRYGLEDGVSRFVSWALLVTVLIYIYPLKALFGSMFYLVSDGQLGHPLGVRTETQARALFSIYALGFTAIAVEILLLHCRAWQLREPLRLNDRERTLTRADMAGWSIPMSVGIVALRPGADASRPVHLLERLDLFFDGRSGARSKTISQTQAPRVKTLRNIFGNVWVLLGLAAFAVSLAILWRNPSFGREDAIGGIIIFKRRDRICLPNFKQFVSTWGI